MTLARVVIVGFLVAGGAARGDEVKDDKADKDEVDARETKRAQEYLKAGAVRFTAGKYKEALTTWKRGAEHEALPEFHYHLGQCYRLLGDVDGATREYRAFLAEVPGAPERREVEGYLAAGAAMPTAAPAALGPPSAAPPPASREPAEPEKCSTGKFVTLATDGHCCWPEQVWSDDQKVCLGIPRCGRGWKVQGNECIRVGGQATATVRAGSCAPGKITSEGHCCWPEQVWVQDGAVCIGTPRCPRGYVARGKDCLPRVSDE